MRFLPVAAAIFFVSLTVRVVHLFQIRRAPFFGLLMGDAQSYDAWAQRLAAGDWIGSDVFYQAPLYPYFLGVIHAIFGRDLLVVRVVQAIVGSLSCVLVALTAKRLFSTRAALVAGLGLALYAPAIFFDGLIQKSVLDVFFISLALWIACRTDLLGPAPTEGLKTPSLRAYRAYLALGLAMGALSLTRENALVLVAVVFLWILVRLKPDTTEIKSARRGVSVVSGFSRTRSAVAFAVGLAIVLVPVALRNYAVGGGLYLTTSQFGPNFYIGNNETATGTYQPLRFGHGDPKYERQDATELAERATGRRLTPAEVSRYWTSRALEYIRTQPGDWLELMGRKITLAWNAAEVADTEDQLSYADWSVLLRLGSRVWHFGVLAPLALFGIWATWPRRAELALLYLLPAAYALALITFAVMGRYRYPLVPFLILFAAAGVANVGQLLDATRRRRLIPGLAAAAAFAIFSNWPLYLMPLMPSMAEMRAITESNVGTELQAQGKLDEAITFYRAALARDPNDAVTRSNLGSALAAKGQLDEAIAQYRTALDLAPNDADGHYNLANALMAQGKLTDAALQFREALRIEPGLADAYLNLGNALVALGQTEEAADHYRRAIELRPDAVEAVNNLGLILAAEGRLDDAIALFQRALAINPNFADAHTNLANAHNDLGATLARQNQLDDAIGHFREAIRLEPGHAEARRNLEMAMRVK
jgi:tetratricopeptide (TPR) repeat protein